MHGDGVIQVVGKSRDTDGRFKSVIEMGADYWGNGQISLRRKLSDSRILSLGTNQIATGPDLDTWVYNGGQVELYSKEGRAFPLSASLFESSEK